MVDYTQKRLITFKESDIPKVDVFQAHGTHFIIPGANIDGIPFRQKVKKANLKNDFKWKSIVTNFKQFWSKFGTRVWFMFVEALWIPSYRPEWGKYKTWKYTYGTRQREKQKKPSLIEEEVVMITSEMSSRASTDSENPDSEAFRLKLSKRKEQRRFTIDSILERRVIKQASRDKGVVPHDFKGCEIVRFNIAGKIYETQRRTLSEFPNTLLGNPERLQRYWDPTREEYFFDRHRRCFESILYYFQSGGNLVRPPQISFAVFEDEIRFYDLGSDVINRFFINEGIMSNDDLAKPLPHNLLLRKLWFFIEYPESSTQAKLAAIFSVFVVIFSTILFCVDTLPTFSKVNDIKMTKSKDPFFLCESVCVIWFTFELLLRLLACPNKTAFLMGAMNIVDVLSIIPYFVTVITPLVSPSTAPGQNSRQHRAAATTLVTLRMFKLFRVFRIFKLSRHSAGLQILAKTLRASLKELGLLLFFLFVCIIIFSSLVYFAEVAAESREFSSIPDTFWWGVVTMTSLGYGDKVPKSIGGRLICTVCAVAAVLTLALPIPIFVSNFNYFYQRETQEETRREMQSSSHVQGCPYLPECPMLMSNGEGGSSPKVKRSQLTVNHKKKSSRLSAPLGKQAKHSRRFSGSEKVNAERQKIADSAAPPATKPL